MDKKLNRAFGAELRRLREKADLSQEALALEAGLDRTFISMLERGVRQPTISTLFQISRVLGIPASDILYEVEKLLRK